MLAALAVCPCGLPGQLLMEAGQCHLAETLDLPSCSAPSPAHAFYWMLAYD